jgi:hypothetical protein
MHINWAEHSWDYLRLLVEETDQGNEGRFVGHQFTPPALKRSGLLPYKWIESNLKLGPLYLDLIETAFATGQEIYISLGRTAVCTSAEEGLSHVAGMELPTSGVRRVLADGPVMIQAVSTVPPAPIPITAYLPPELHYVLCFKGRPDQPHGTFQRALREMLHTIRCNPSQFGSAPEDLEYAALEALQWLDKLAYSLRTPDTDLHVAPESLDTVIPAELHGEASAWDSFLMQQSESRGRLLTAARRDLWASAYPPQTDREAAWHRSLLLNPELVQLSDCAEELTQGVIPYSRTAAGALVSGLMFYELNALKRTLNGDALTKSYWNPSWIRQAGIAYGYAWRALAALLASQFADGDHVVLFLVFFSLVALWRLSDSRNAEAGGPRQKLFNEMVIAYSLTLDGVPASGAINFAESLTRQGTVWPQGTLQILGLMAEKGDSFQCLRPHREGASFIPSQLG